jgi:hypothetical protein
VSVQFSGSVLLRSLRGLLLTGVLASGLYCGTGSVYGEDWPWFLGPRHTGESGETGIVLDWTAGPPPVLWKQAIGTGYSAPSLLGDQLGRRTLAIHV